MISSLGKLNRFFSSAARLTVTALVLCCTAALCAIPGYAASNTSVCTLTITVTVAPTVQNSNIVSLINSLPATPANVSGVTFNLAPENSQVTSSQIDTQEISVASRSAGESIASSEQGKPAILQTMTVVSK